jgi:hypothetical protein
LLILHAWPTLPTATGTWTVTASSNTNFVMGLDRNTGNLVWFAEYAPTIKSLATDGAGNLYMESTISSATAAPWTYLYGPGTGGSPITFNPTASGSSVTAFVKCDSNGNIVWSGNFSTSSGTAGARSMAVDGAGNIYFGGGFGGTVDFDPGPGVKNLTAVFGSGDGVIVKIGANGSLAWVAHNTVFTNNCTDVLVDSSGNVDAGWTYPWALSVTDTVTGHGSHQTTTRTIVGGYLTQFDNNGNLKWYSSPSGIHGMLLDPAGNIYMGKGSPNAELVKYSSAGNLVWSVPDYGYPIYSITIDALGDIWTNGGSSTSSSVDVSPTSTPVYLPWTSTWPLTLVKWTQPGGFAAASTQQSAGTLTSTSSPTLGTAAPLTASTVTQPVIYVGDDRFLTRIESYLDLASALRARVADIDYVDLRFAGGAPDRFLLALLRPAGAPMRDLRGQGAERGFGTAEYQQLFELRRRTRLIGRQGKDIPGNARSLGWRGRPAGSR